MFPNIPVQYQWNSLADRALKPNGPLLPLNDYLKVYLEPSEDLNNKARPHLKKLDELFPDCKVIIDVPKRQKAEVTLPKTEEDVENIKNGSNKDAPISTNGDDKGLFAPDDVDVKMEEVGCRLYVKLI